MVMDIHKGPYYFNPIEDRHIEDTLLGLLTDGSKSPFLKSVTHILK